MGPLRRCGLVVRVGHKCFDYVGPWGAGILWEDVRYLESATVVMATCLAAACKQKPSGLNRGHIF